MAKLKIDLTKINVKKGKKILTLIKAAMDYLNGSGVKVYVKKKRSKSS